MSLKQDDLGETKKRKGRPKGTARKPNHRVFYRKKGAATSGPNWVPPNYVEVYAYNKAKARKMIEGRLKPGYEIIDVRHFSELLH